MRLFGSHGRLNMNLSELAKMVDDGCRINMKIKALEKELDPIKSSLKAEAKKRNKTEILGTEGAMVKVTPSGGATVKPEHFAEKVEALKLGDDVFYDNVTVKLGDARDVIGEIHFNAIAKPFTVPFNVVKFLPAKKAPKK